MTLTKEHLVETLVKAKNFHYADAKNFVDAFFSELVSNLENSFDMRISGFGNFSLNDKKSRPGRNPKTGDEVIISSRRVVTFKAGQKMKLYIQEKLEK